MTTVKKLTKKVQKVLQDDDNVEIKDDDVWHAIKSFFDENGLIQSQIGSYNNFIHHKSHQILEHFSDISIEEAGKKYQIELSNLTFTQPQFVETNDSAHPLTPIEALWRNANYSAQMFIDVTVIPPSGEPSFYEKIHLGNMPVMVRSDLCNITKIASDRQKVTSLCEDPMDNGGYFVIVPKSEGSSGVAQRKILVPQERASPNQIFVFYDRKKKPRYEIYAEIRSNNTTIHTTTLTAGFINGKISCLLPWIDSADIPLGILFRALGVDNEKEMVKMCIADGLSKSDISKTLDLLTPTFEQSYECKDREVALRYIGKRGRKFTKVENEEEEETPDMIEEKGSDAISYAKHLLSMELLPHCGQGENSYTEKAKFVGQIVQNLLDIFFERTIPESRDHDKNKRMISTGSLLGQQFYGALRRLITEISNNTRNALKKGNTVNITSWIKSAIITNSMHGAIANNSWNTGGDSSKGISQTYEQFNYTASVSNLRKTTTPMSAEGGKNIEPRDLHQGQWGIRCLAETPEGKKAGLVKNLAMMAYITLGTDSSPVKEIISNFLSKSGNSSSIKSKIFVNGAIVGSTHEPKELISLLREARRTLSLGREISIAYFESRREIKISTDEGRLCRPLFIVKDGKMTIKMKTINRLKVGEEDWTHLLASGTVELIDKIEEETCRIALYPSDLYQPSSVDPKVYTHCEMHPSMILGIGGSLIPFPDHNQCIYQEELVLMSNGTTKKIKDVRPGDLISNFDPITKRIGTARVINVLSKETNKQMYRLGLENKSIVATYDHRFHTSKGWRCLENINVGDLVSIYNKSGLITYETVKSKEYVLHRLISDITTNSPHQSFFCNLFGVHNSPRNTYQCVWKEEPVLMGDSTWKKIKDVKVGDEVISFDPETMLSSITKVVHAHTMKTTKKIVKVTTQSNKAITVTEDHKIMTIEGWKEAGSLTIGIDKIGTAQYMVPDKSSERIGDYIFELVKEILSMDNVEISDITTESENHSFIAGDGICVHNSAMGKQAIGIPFRNYKKIMTGTFHTMMHLQRPIVMSRSSAIIGFDELPAGLNAITIICPRPFNEEDSIEMSQSAIDRGFMNSFKWMAFYAQIDEEKGESFAIPIEEECNKFKGNPSTLGPEGFALPGTKLNNGDIVIGRIIAVDGDLKKPYNSSSLLYDQQWPSVVESVQVGTTAEGYKYYRVVVSQLRKPIIGDKFAFRNAQKGTVGMLRRTEDLPFDEDGITPDIIINSLALPSRMTIAMFIEMVTGKSIISTSYLHKATLATLGLGAIKDGETIEPIEDENPAPKSRISKEFTDKMIHNNSIDATPFRKDFSIDLIIEELKKYGADYGDSRFTDGVTGNPLRGLIFNGPCYSQRLKHMTVDKKHSRSKGGRTALVRQPTEGRSVGGGLRVGTMEKDCLLGQGAARFSRDRLMEQSDEYKMWICSLCGLPAFTEAKGRVKECRVCGTNKVVLTRIPYATKLASQELMSMNMVPRILTIPYKDEGLKVDE